MPRPPGGKELTYLLASPFPVVLCRELPWFLKCQGPQSPGWDPKSWRPPLAQRVKEGRVLRSTQGSATRRAGLPGPALGLETSLCFSVLAVYRCGSPWGWSRPYGFRALLNGSSWSPRFAIFGDMGLENPQSLPRLQRETQQGWYDAVLHIGRLSGCPALPSSLPLTVSPLMVTLFPPPGDFAYDLHSVRHLGAPLAGKEDAWLENSVTRLDPVRLFQEGRMDVPMVGRGGRTLLPGTGPIPTSVCSAPQDNALVGDAFMRKIEAVAAFVPYMTCPGNHEEM